MSVYIPVEILLDIFCFLNRDEIETCQVVSHKWSAIIRKNDKNLPLFRKLLNLTITETGKKSFDLLISSNNFLLQLVIKYEISLIKRKAKFTINEEQKIQLFGIQSCIFNLITYRCSKNCTNAITLEFFKLMTELCGTLRTNSFFIVEKESTSRCLYNIYPDIFDKYIFAKRVSFGLDRKKLIKCVHKLNTLALLSPPETITVCLRNIKLDKLFRFISSKKLYGASKYWLSVIPPFEENMSNFCESIIKLFLKSTRPESLPRNIRFPKPLTHDCVVEQQVRLFRDHTENVLRSYAYNFNFKHKSYDDQMRDKYELKKDDGWSLAITLVWIDTEVDFCIYKSS